MQQIVINACYGGFGLSDTAQLKYLELAGVNIPQYHWDIDRDNPHLVQVVKQLGKSANTPYSTLKVVEIPDDVDWTIHEYDGREWVAEVHRTWS
jgi:hypothetical protein